MIHFLLIGMSFWLSCHDYRHQEYPLWIWLVFSLLALLFAPLKLLVICFLLLAILAEIIDLRIGSGDFLYLATLSLCLSLTQILWLIQIASWAGILAFLAIRDKQKRIAFLPFLSVAYVMILLVNSWR